MFCFAISFRIERDNQTTPKKNARQSGDAFYDQSLSDETRRCQYRAPSNETPEKLATVRRVPRLTT
jgi:hypothetical protein